MQNQLLCCFILQVSAWAHGQIHEEQYAFVTESSQQVNDLYSEANRLRVFQGVKYVPVAINKLVDIGSPYYLRSKLDEETVTIEGTPFFRVPVMFDLMQNKVVSAMPGTTLLFSMVNQDVDQFTLDSHTFVNIRDSLIRQLGFEPGFYDLLYDGNRLKAFARRIKKYSESSNTIRYGARIQKIYTDKTDLFVWMDGRFFLIKNRKALVSLLKNKQPQVDDYLMRERKRLSKGSLEETIVTISRMFDTL